MYVSENFDDYLVDNNQIKLQWLMMVMIKNIKRTLEDGKNYIYDNVMDKSTLKTPKLNVVI